MGSLQTTQCVGGLTHHASFRITGFLLQAVTTILHCKIPKLKFLTLWPKHNVPALNQNHPAPPILSSLLGKCQLLLDVYEGV